MKAHLTIRISGKVQGVWFRQAAKDQASILGLDGFVKNEHDGTVYLEAEGEERDLDDFLTWCKRGPANAGVSHILAEEGELKGYSGFTIMG